MRRKNKIYVVSGIAGTLFLSGILFLMIFLQSIFADIREDENIIGDRSDIRMLIQQEYTKRVEFLAVQYSVVESVQTFSNNKALLSLLSGFLKNIPSYSCGYVFYLANNFVGEIPGNGGGEKVIPVNVWETIVREKNVIVHAKLGEEYATIGVPIINKKGVAIGAIAVIYNQKIAENEYTVPMLLARQNDLKNNLFNQTEFQYVIALLALCFTILGVGVLWVYRNAFNA